MRTALLLVYFWFGSGTKKYLSLVRALIFCSVFVHTQERWVENIYYHLYHEEASFPLDVHPQLFNRPYSYLLKRLK